MRKTLIRFFILLKNNIFSKSFYLFVILMFIGCLSINEYQNNADNIPRISGILETESNLFNDSLRDELISNDSFVLYENYDSLIKDIELGKICCGFILGDNIDDYDPQKYKGYSVSYISTAKLKESESFKEIFFDCFLKEYNNKLISYLSNEIIEETTSETEEKIIDYKNRYLDSEKLFSVSIEYIDGNNNDFEATVFPLKGVIGLCIFLSALFTGFSFYDNEKKIIIDSFIYTQKIKTKVLFLLSFVLPVSILGIIFQTIFKPENIIANLLKLVVLVVYSIIWVIISQSIIKNKKVYSALLFTVIALSLFICPIVICTEQYVPAIKYIKYIIPVSVYL